MALTQLNKFSSPLLKTSLKQAGFASDEILNNWGSIAGELIAENTLPLKIQWGKRATQKEQQEAGVLHVLVEPAFMLELEYQKNYLLENINRFFGWQAVKALKFKQSPLPAKQNTRAKQPSLQQKLRAEKIVGELDNEPLKEALKSLGSHILAQNKL